MVKKENNSRTINALLAQEEKETNSENKTTSTNKVKSSNEFLKKYFGSRSLALKIRGYLLIVLIIQAFLLLFLLGFISLLLWEKEIFIRERDKSYLKWSKISEEFPNSPDILFNIAKSSYESGRRDEAIVYLKRAIEIDPLFERAKDLLGEIK